MSVENNIPEGWEVSRLDEISEFIFDCPHSTPLWTHEGFIVLRNQNIRNGKLNLSKPSFTDEKGYLNRVKRAIPKEGDIVLTREAPMGEVCMIPSEVQCCLGQRMVLIRILNTVASNNFILYSFQSPLLKLQIKWNEGTGTTVSNIRIPNIKAFEFLLPPLSEQKAIAAILTAFDDKIENLQAQNKTLETIAQTIFKEWFGKYQIGDELPEGWRVGKLSEFISKSIGGDYGKESLSGDYTEETICLRGTDLPGMKMGVPEKAPRRFLKKSKIEKCRLKNGDIVIEISGGTENQSTGRVAYINQQILNKSDLPMTCVNFCRVLRPCEPENSYFIYSLFEYLYNRKVFFNWENGTTGIKNLSLKALLEGFDLLLPQSNEKIMKFNQIIKSFFIGIQENNSQIQTLQQTRDTLLPKLMSGQIRVKGFEG